MAYVIVGGFSGSTLAVCILYKLILAELAEYRTAFSTFSPRQVYLFEIKHIFFINFKLAVKHET